MSTPEAASVAHGQPSIAIVGAGASGLFTAQFLRRLRQDVQIDLIEALPVPLGLIRYGVAPDHQGTKQVARQFERLWGSAGISFYGNVRVGVDVTVDELLELYDAVVLATGLDHSRQLGIPGETLLGVLDSGAVTRWINSYPDGVSPADCLGDKVVIVGNGNVAIDLARLIAKTPLEFTGSDIDLERHRKLTGARVRRIELIGRGSPESASFDPAMVRELGTLKDARVEVEWPVGSGGHEEHGGIRTASLMAASVGTLVDASTVISFRFRKRPLEIAGGGAVEALICEDMDRGTVVHLPATSVIKAIGFIPSPDEPLTYERDGSGALTVSPSRTWPVGWFRGGARGTLADSRADAKNVAEKIAAALDSSSGRHGRKGLAGLLTHRGVRYVDHAGWDRIRTFEDARGTRDRVRIKVATRQEMLEIAGTTGDGGN